MDNIFAGFDRNLIIVRLLKLIRWHVIALM